MALVAGFGIWVYTWLGGARFHNLLQLGGDIGEILSLLLGAAGLSLAGLLLWLVISRVIEAGLFNMYKSAIQSGSVQPGSFGAGVMKFSLPFLLGDILIALAVLLTSPIWGLLGVVTLTIGFTVGAIGLGVFLMFWKVSLVWNQGGIIEALKDSVRFSWRNLVAVTLLFLVRKSFLSPNGGGGTGNVSNIFNLNNFGSPPAPGPAPGIVLNPDDIIRYLRIGVSIATPVLIIIVALGALIKMIFDVFFGLAVFVTYKHGFKPEEEVGPDVV